MMAAQQKTKASWGSKERSLNDSYSKDSHGGMFHLPINPSPPIELGMGINTPADTTQVNLMSPVTLHDISSIPKHQPYSEANPSLYSSHINSSINGRRSLSKASSIRKEIGSNGH